MSWYKLAKVENGKYVLDPDGRLHPCHSHVIKDCVNYVADQYNVLTKNQDKYSIEYFNEVLDNGFAIVTLGNIVNVYNSKSLNPTQQSTISVLKRKRG